MSKITPCLWFDGQAEEAANFYAGLLPDSRVDKVVRAPADYPSGKKGDVLIAFGWAKAEDLDRLMPPA